MPTPVPTPVPAPPAPLTIKGARIAEALSHGINVAYHLSWDIDPAFTLNQYQAYPVPERNWFEFGQFSRINATGRPWHALTIGVQAETFELPAGYAVRLPPHIRAVVTPPEVEYIPPTASLGMVDTMIPPVGPPFPNGDWFTAPGAASLLIQPDEDVELDRTLVRWTAGSHFVEYQVHSVLGRPELFRSCWHVNLPNVIRLACYTWAPEPDNVIGESTSDDSDGGGRRAFSIGP